MNERIGAQIRAIREQKSFRQEELMHPLGLASKAQVSRIESGERKITAAELRRLAEFLEVPVDALIYPELFGVAYRADASHAERSADMQWFRDFRRRYRLFVGS